MRQLQLFTTAELAVIRDRTASRSYSPAGDQFRREHERHRSWGLARRHAERLRRLAGSDGGPHAPTAAENPLETQISPAPVSIPPDQAERGAVGPGLPTGRNRSRPDAQNAADQPGPVGKAPSGPVGKAPSGPVGKAPSGPVGKAPSGPVGKAPSGPVGKAPLRSVGLRRSRPAGQPPAPRVGTPRSGPARIWRYGPATNAAPDFPETNNRPRITPSKTRRDRGDRSRDRHFPTRAPPPAPCCFLWLLLVRRDAPDAL